MLIVRLKFLTTNLSRAFSDLQDPTFKICKFFHSLSYIDGYALLSFTAYSMLNSMSRNAWFHLLRENSSTVYRFRRNYTERERHQESKARE